MEKSERQPKDSDGLRVSVVDSGSFKKTLAKVLLAIPAVLLIGCLVVFVVVLAPWSLALLGVTLLIVISNAVVSTRK